MVLYGYKGDIMRSTLFLGRIRRFLNGIAGKTGNKRAFTLIEIMVSLVIVGILAAYGMQALLNQRKGSRLVEFENEVNAAMAEITRVVSNPDTCFATFHDLGPGAVKYDETLSDKYNKWKRVEKIIYDETKPEDDEKNIVARTFPVSPPNGPARPFRGSKILGIKSMYLTPHDYPNYRMQTENLPESRQGNAFVEITFEYIGPENTMIGLKTRTKVLPLSVTWAKKFVWALGSDENNAKIDCDLQAESENCSPEACTGTIGACSEVPMLGVNCDCAIYQSSLQHWTIRECNAVSSGG